jgi:hypothetical protein
MGEKGTVIEYSDVVVGPKCLFWPLRFVFAFFSLGHLNESPGVHAGFQLIASILPIPTCAM